LIPGPLAGLPPLPLILRLASPATNLTL
jgi:hypothetical protein